MATLISTCTSWQELSETASAANALEKIVLGHHVGPLDVNADQFSVDELAAMFCECHLIPPVTGGHEVVTGSGGPDAEQGGEFDMTIRRHVREKDADRLDELYLGFLDTIAALEVEIIEKADATECPRLLRLKRTGGPAYGSWKTQTAQGEYLWAHHRIYWGDPVES